MVNSFETHFVQRHLTRAVASIST